MSYQDYVLRTILEAYLRDELDEYTTANIRIASEEIALDDWLVYIIEIAYAVGYARSILQNKISEPTYKRTKLLVKSNLKQRLTELLK